MNFVIVSPEGRVMCVRNIGIGLGEVIKNIEV